MVYRSNDSMPCLMGYFAVEKRLPARTRFVNHLFTVVIALAGPVLSADEVFPRPNILIAITDDHSWIHTSAEGSRFVDTPSIDRISEQGLHFSNAYSGSPGCSPSRAALLTGLHHWMIGPAGTHASTFPVFYESFVDVLEQSGYRVGFTGKGWGPGDWLSGGRTRNPAGDEYNEVRLKGDRPAGISDIDYAGNFGRFMADRKESEPFYFWVGLFFFRSLRQISFSWSWVSLPVPASVHFSFVYKLPCRLPQQPGSET